MSKTTPKPFCDWRSDEDGNWDTECGEKHILLDGGPKWNGMLYCCYCGLKLREKSGEGR